MRAHALWWMVLIVLAAPGGAGGEPADPAEQVRLAATHLLHGTDAEFAGSRADLANWDAARLLQVIDAARAQRFRAGEGLVVGGPSAEPSMTDEGPAAKAESSTLVAALSSQKSWRARVRAWPLRIEEQYAARWFGAYMPPSQGHVREVPAAYARQLLRAAGQDAFLRAEPCPPLVLADGQSGLITQGASFRYVQDYDVESGMGGGFATDPILGLLHEGVRLGVVARQTQRGTRLEVDMQWSEVIRPIPTFEATFEYSPKVTLELPELRMMNLRETVQVPAGGWVLVATGQPFPKGAMPGTDRCLALLHVEVLAR